MRDFNIQCPMFNIQYPKWKRGQFQKRGQFHKLIFLMLITLVATSFSASAEDKARSMFEAGLKAFATSNYVAASESFEEAAAAAPAEKLDPVAAHYNAALASYAAGDLQKASTAFASAAAGSDLDLQAKAYYNRGNALFHLANTPLAPTDPAQQTNALDLGEAAIGQAIQMFENAIALNPQDTDAKANYELAVLKQQELQQQKQQQQQQKDQQNQDDQKEDKKDPQQDQQQKQDQQNQEQKQQDQQKEQQKQEQQQAKDQDSQKEQAKEAQPEKPSEEMTPEEAAMMLDAMKAQEQSQRDQLHPFFGRPVPVEKDW